MMKKITGISLALILLLGLTPLTALAANDDYPSKWAEVDVQTAVFAGLVPDNLQSKYTQATTRAEFCALAVALFETVTGEAITGRIAFNDTEDVNVEKMAFIKVVNGTSPGKFTPDAQLTREQAATMLARLSDALGKPFPLIAAEFDDKSSISSWALEAVGRVQAAGIMTGTSVGKFSPKGPYTREQSIVTMLRVYNNVNEPPEVDPGEPDWLGSYINFDADVVMEITKYDGTQFWVDLYKMGGDPVYLNGWAEVEADNPFFAMLGGIGLSLYEDGSGIDLFAGESTEWAHLRGHYERSFG